MRGGLLWRPKSGSPVPPSEKAGKKERKKYTRETSLEDKEVSLALPQESRLEKMGR